MVESGETSPGWTLARAEAPRLWLCPTHAADGPAVLNRTIDTLWKRLSVLGVFRARVETLVQWAEGEHHKAFDDEELLTAIHRYARLRYERPTQ
jgi:hypothetical protein